jgi:hypothetical protein
MASLETRITDLTTRIATEFKTVRTEMVEPEALAAQISAADERAIAYSIAL